MIVFLNLDSEIIKELKGEEIFGGKFFFVKLIKEKLVVISEGKTHDNNFFIS